MPGHDPAPFTFPPRCHAGPRPGIQFLWKYNKFPIDVFTKPGEHSIADMKTYFVYVVCNKSWGTLYIGVTNNLQRRMWEHKNDAVEGFTKKYGLHTLAYYEQFFDVRVAIAREKNLKNWKRAWKIDLVEKMNPQWKDLTPDL